MSEHAEHVAHPYYKVFAWLTVFTVLEIAWAEFFFSHTSARLVGILGLTGMAIVKAALVGLYYMHLKYEGKLIWGVILFPLLLVVVLIAGFLPDAIQPYGG